jgi:transcriptional regulator with XRE-family HTH domain
LDYTQENGMTGKHLKDARRKRGWTQAEAARRLRVSQTYVSLLEREQRHVPDRLATRLLRAYEFSPVAVPLSGHRRVDQDQLAAALAKLGYPGFSYLSDKAQLWNPAELLLSALAEEDLDTRLAEALPWVAMKYSDLDWEWLLREAKVRDLQNRLGFVVTLARELAERRQNQDLVERLGAVENRLRRSRLVEEDTLAHSRLSNAERRWLQEHRPSEAREWNLLTDMSVDHLTHAA